MLNTYSQIRFVEQDFGIYKRLTLEWQGDEPIARIPRRELYHFGIVDPQRGQEFKLEGMRLVSLGEEENFIANSYLVCRQDDMEALWLFAFDWLGQRLRTFKFRIILTFAIWGLAKREYGAEPQWSDVHFIKLLLD